MNSNMSVPSCVFHPCDIWPSSFHVEFFHTCASYLTIHLYPKIFPVVSQCMCFSVVSTAIVPFSGLYVCHDLLISEVLFLLYSPLKNCGKIVKYGDMVYVMSP